jgi:2-aminobenzoate-CoA ligase
MAVIPRDCLPPEEYLPETVQLLPELRYPERLNLARELLDSCVEAHPYKTAVYFDDERISYRDLQQRVNRFANALRELGIERNDRVLLRSPNVPEYLVWNFACWRMGAIPVLVNHLNRHEEVSFKANDTEAVAICVHQDFYEDVAKAQPRCPSLRHVVLLGEGQPNVLDYAELVSRQPDMAETEDTGRDDFARIIYSSGTTGKPKGILQSMGGLLSSADTHGRHVLGIREDDVLGGHPYFTFAFGSVNFTVYPWRFGASVSVILRFSPEEQLRLVQDHGVTMLFAVPTALRMMLGVTDAERRWDLSSLRLCQSAGEWLPEVTVSEWEDRLGTRILDSLGSGDLNYWLSTTADMGADSFGSTGVSVPGYENVIVDENFKEVAPGTMGELLVRGPVGQTYWRRPDKQVEGVCPLESEYRGWSRPGLVFTKDERGHFWYKSRSDDMIVTAGYKIPGGEVEAVLNCHPAVLESAVIDTPDPERGNLIKAFVVLRPGGEPSPELARELQDFVKRELEPYKYPRVVEFAGADDLPRTSTGKIQRSVLRQREHARDLAR